MYTGVHYTLVYMLAVGWHRAQKDKIISRKWTDWSEIQVSVRLNIWIFFKLLTSIYAFLQCSAVARGGAEKDPPIIMRKQKYFKIDKFPIFCRENYCDLTLIFNIKVHVN